MQSLWTRAATSTSRSCRCYRCAKTSRDATSVQNVSIASRRRLLIGNGVTLLYSGIFASAAVLDAAWKDKRRTDRDKQIEAVKAEVQELKEEEARLLAQLERRGRSYGLLHNFQKRQYTTTASVDSAPAHERNQTPIRPEFDAPEMRDSDYTEQSTPGVLEPEPEMGETGDEEYEWLTTSNQSSRSFGRHRAIQLLAMKQLAYRLLLRPNIAHSYECVRRPGGVSSGYAKVDVQGLLDAIDKNHQRIRDIRSTADAPFEDLVDPLTLEEHSQLLDQRKELEESLRTTFSWYRRGKFCFSELLVEVSDNLLAAREPILMSTLCLLIHAFDKAQQRDIVLMIMNTLFPNGFSLTQYTISVSIGFFAKTRDLGKFEGFLSRLRDEGSSLQRRPWKIVRVDGVDISVPPNPSHLYVIINLIRAALNFDQPHRADAYLKHFKAEGFGQDVSILRAYLRYYSQMQNWDRGLPFLRESVEHLKVVGSQDRFNERLILFMMVFCRTLGKHELARDMMNSAVTSGIDWRRSQQNGDAFDGVVSTSKRWQKVQAAAKNIVPDRPPEGRTKYYVFARKIEDLVDKEVLEASMTTDARKQEEISVSNLRGENRRLKKILLSQRVGLRRAVVPRVNGRIRMRFDVVKQGKGSRSTQLEPPRATFYPEV